MLGEAVRFDKKRLSVERSNRVTTKLMKSTERLSEIDRPTEKLAERQKERQRKKIQRKKRQREKNVKSFLFFLSLVLITLFSPVSSLCGLLS